MSQDTSSALPFVWVTVGKTQHAAFLVQRGGHDSTREGNKEAATATQKKQPQCLVQWASNDDLEWVDSDTVQTNLTPRKRRATSSSSTEAAATSPKKRQPARRVSTNTPPCSNTSQPLSSFFGNKLDTAHSDTSVHGSQKLPAVTAAVGCDDQAAEAEHDQPDNNGDRNKNVDMCIGNESKDEDNTEDDDDDEVEFMFTLPKTPPRPAKQPSSTNRNGEELEEKEEPPAGSTSSDMLQDHKKCAALSSSKSVERRLLVGLDDSVAVASALGREASEASFSNEGIQRNASSSSFRLVQSAYVQTLAEISHTVMTDARWRVSGNLPLFRWELGDDLSALLALKRLYCLPAPPLSLPSRVPDCVCLLCKKKKSHSDDRGGSSHINDDGKKQSVGNTVRGANNDEKPMGTADEATRNVNDDDKPEHEDESIRWLYLYCRLFNRRGPWFKIDDIYDRYYKPNKDNNDSDTPKSNVDMEKAEAEAQQPSSTGRKVVFQHSRLPLHLNRFRELCQDLEKLSSALLIRSFQDEEECGVTVGQTLLTQDIRKRLLAKLGVKQNSNSNRRKGTMAAAAKKEPRNENQVWRQMNRQQSIFSSLKQGSSSSFATKSSKLLPVIPHVNALLMEKLTLDIIKSCCGLSTASGIHGAHVPSALRKEHEKGILAELMSLAKQSGFLLPSSSNTCFACWKMREAPAECLRRAARLYLCATSGPGDMRSDENNGWKSVSLETIGPNVKLPLSNRVRPSGVHTWSSVSYHGSMVRFGLRPALFRRSYQPIEASEKSGTMSSHCQIFSNAAMFQAWELCAELRACVDYWVELDDLMRYDLRQKARINKQDENLHNESGREILFDSVDFLNLLTVDGKDALLKTFLATFDLDAEMSLDLKTSMQQSIQMDIQALFADNSTDLTECERILVTVAIIAIHSLQYRTQYISPAQAERMSRSPWLRHLWWEGCLAYILWDVIPILERSHHYEWAIKALRVLLGDPADSEGTSSCIGSDNPLASLLLSRRARGKALDRLVIDTSHLERRKAKAADSKALKKQSSSDSAARMVIFCEKVLERVVAKAAISFASIRGIARRLKRPLAQSLENISPCLEVGELGLRLENESLKADANKYSDWTPIVDKATANAVAGENDGAGSRCVFIGHEDSSLNVEELAMECYNSGRLPLHTGNDNDKTKGGWVGWHCEGSHLRAIFRILSSAPLLGTDWGCGTRDPSEDSFDLDSIFLSPYQEAPLDLHVGHGVAVGTSETGDHVSGFYSRRKKKIDLFLAELSQTNPQGIADAVHDSIAARLSYTIASGWKDPFIQQDLSNLRTLSLIASGCGGQQLASAFRCLLFDYRHYSGGLPDLLLVRAHIKKRDGTRELLDLSEYVGESLSKSFKEEQEARRFAQLMLDEEFLGCSKVGDSGNNRQRRERVLSSKPLSMEDLPARLELLSDEGLFIEPECMFVEVKSSNDRLDGRQEDWLNVLDRNGNARVCKFEDSRRTKKSVESIKD